jgi:hypothetical protein
MMLKAIATECLATPRRNPRRARPPVVIGTGEGTSVLKCLPVEAGQSVDDTGALI